LCNLYLKLTTFILSLLDMERTCTAFTVYLSWIKLVYLTPKYNITSVLWHIPTDTWYIMAWLNKSGFVFAVGILVCPFQALFIHFICTYQMVMLKEGSVILLFAVFFRYYEPLCVGIVQVDKVMGRIWCLKGFCFHL